MKTIPLKVILLFTIGMVFIFVSFAHADLVYQQPDKATQLGGLDGNPDSGRFSIPLGVGGYMTSAILNITANSSGGDRKLRMRLKCHIDAGYTTPCPNTDTSGLIVVSPLVDIVHNVNTDYTFDLSTSTVVSSSS